MAITRKKIIVDDKNTILDGQHRACILAGKYGEKSYIRILKIWDIKKRLFAGLLFEDEHNKLPFDIG